MENSSLIMERNSLIRKEYFVFHFYDVYVSSTGICGYQSSWSTAWNMPACAWFVNNTGSGKIFLLVSNTSIQIVLPHSDDSFERWRQFILICVEKLGSCLKLVHSRYYFCIVMNKLHIIKSKRCQLHDFVIKNCESRKWKTFFVDW